MGKLIGPRIAAVLMFCLGLNALAQVPQALPSWGGDPALLSLEQLVVGVAGVSAGYGAWRSRPWAWIATLVWGATSAILVGTLGPVLGLDADERSGLVYAAGAIVVIAGSIAWYLRRRR